MPILLYLLPVEDASRKKRGDTKDNPLSQWFMNFSEADELLHLAASRQQVSMHASNFITSENTWSFHPTKCIYVLETTYIVLGVTILVEEYYQPRYYKCGCC